MEMKRIPRSADKSGMNPYGLLDESPLAEVREAQPAAAPAGTDRVGHRDVPFLTQIEQLLGEETEPDAGFFVDSWTEGVAAASENFLRRQERKNHETPWNLSWSFAPFFEGGADAAAESPWPRREALAEHSSMAGPGRHGGDEEAEEPAADEATAVSSPTLESARRMLGVEATSTRVQIRAAYRRMVNLYHPDLPAYRGAREQKLASDRMASINEAYRQLCAGSTVTTG